MRAEHWILSLAAVFGVFIVMAAMLPDDLWEEDLRRSSKLMANTVGKGGGIPGPALGMAPGYPKGGAGPAIAGRQPASRGAPWGRNVAIPGLVPFSRASTERFQGKIVHTVSLGVDVGWGQVHVWVDGAPPSPREVSLAPDWYLQYMGCPVQENAWVEGIAFVFDKKRPDAELYAKTITVNGKMCRLRNDEGFALWSNRLQ